MPSRPFEPAAGARITVFHCLALLLIVMSAAAAWWFSRSLGAWWRAGITIVAFVAAIPLCLGLVTLLVTMIIPRLTPGSPWSREVNAYMLSMLGREWADAGKPRSPSQSR